MIRPFFTFRFIKKDKTRGLATRATIREENSGLVLEASDCDARHGLLPSFRHPDAKGYPHESRAPRRRLGNRGRQRPPPVGIRLEPP